MKITIVTVTYNCVNDLQATIDSVVNQSYNNIEHIIIDGASKDGTLNVIKNNVEKYTDKVIRWISEPDKGIYDAMNKGITMATGDYINFLNAGDIYHSSTCIEEMFAEPFSADILYGTIHFITTKKTIVVTPAPLKELENRMIMGHPSVFAKSSVIKEFMFDTSYRSSGDYDFLYRCYKAGKTFECRDVVVADFDGNYGFSNQNPAIVWQENARIRGIDNKLYWKVNLFFKLRWHMLKRFILKVIG